MLREIVRKTLKLKSSKPERLDVGCGAKEPKSGFVGVDIRKFPHVKYVCNSWEISDLIEQNAVLEIYSRHFLEHLTFLQADKTLQAWNQILTPNGKMQVIVPDIGYHIEQFLDERVEGKSAANPQWSLKEHAIAGFWGWQREGATQVWDVHKSGYTFEMLSQKLSEHGFTDIERLDDKPWHLNVICRKQNQQDAAFLVQKLEQEAFEARGGGERQASPDLSKVRADHRQRYEFATQYISSGDQVLDLACGVGYGSYIIANQTECSAIQAVDLSSEAIDYANKYYSNAKISYVQGDCFEVPIERDRFDVCISFETVEHIPDDLRLLKRFHTALKPGGTLILSTPNQQEMPFSPDQFPFHCKHYLPKELESLVNQAGFVIDQVAAQKDKKTGEITPGWEGKFNLLVCKKSPRRASEKP